MRDWAQQQSNDNGNVPCIAGFGRCITAADHEREAIRQIIRTQGVFSLSSRFTSERFQQEQAFGMCAVYYDACPYAPIADEAADLDLDEVEPPLVLVATAPAVGAVGHRLGLTPNPRMLEAVTAHIATEIVNGTRRAAPAMREETNLQEATDACFRSPLLSLTGLVRTPGGSSHPCQSMPVYFPGPNLGPAYRLRRDALDNNRVLHLQNYLHEDMRTDGLSRNWHNSEVECIGRPLGVPSDEFPSYSTVQAQGLRPGRNFVTIGPWELGIDTNGNVIYHAIYRP